MPRQTSPLTVFSTGLALGLVTGLAAWGSQLSRSRQALFHPRPTRRMAAISYLRARPSVDSVRLLRDYVAWETHPVLRRRGQRALRRVETALH
jgi:hypothetical protein